MKKQRKQLILLIVVLLLLVAGYFGVQKYNEVQSNKEDASVEMVQDIVYDEVTQVSYTCDGEELTFVKEEDTWKYQTDTSLSIVQSSMASMISQITSMESLGKIENVTDMSEYGLDEPVQQISFVAGGVTYEVAVGDYNEVSDIDYINVNGSSIVYAIDTAFGNAFEVTLDELIEEVEE